MCCLSLSILAEGEDAQYGRRALATSPLHPIAAASPPAQIGLGGPAHLPLRFAAWCGAMSSQAGECSLRRSVGSSLVRVTDVPQATDRRRASDLVSVPVERDGRRPAVPACTHGRFSRGLAESGKPRRARFLGVVQQVPSGALDARLPFGERNLHVVGDRRAVLE